MSELNSIDYRRQKLDSLFEAMLIIAEGSYVFLCDMKTNISRWSKIAVDYFSLPDEYISDAGELWAEHIHPDDRQPYLDSINAVFSGKESHHDMQYRARIADGTYTVCTCKGIVIHDDNGNPEYFCGAIRNHSIFSYIDSVTGLKSLYSFFDSVKALISNNTPSFLVMLGVSSFSDINDVYGYIFGNRVLQAISRKIQEAFSEKGEVYRMNGSRFSVISKDIDAQEAEKIYNELQNYFKKDFFVDGERVTISMNCGGIYADNFDISWETFYSCLRYAYYESKHRRFGSFVTFNNVMSVENKQYLEQINTIRNCIAEDCKGFYLCYQPIVDSQTEKLKGMEALIRWKSDEYGVVPPDRFIPVLEQDSMFPELGKWILKQAMEDGKKFLEFNSILVINVNLSYTQLERDDFVKELFEIIEKTGFPMDHLCLEITERCRLLDTSLLKNMFSVFRDSGIKIAVDDFGTGFSSLGFLRTVPVDVVKIDKDFVKDIQKNSADRHSVKFISELADAFSADVCAEGIENTDIRDCLKQYKICSLQGYYYSKPITADEIVKILQNEK